MRILDRYLIRGFAYSFAACLLLIFILFVTVDIFNHLDEFLKNSVRLWVIFSYYFYLLPNLFVQIVPIATLLAVLYTLSALNRHHEIIAMKAGGVSPLHILYPYLFAGMLISFSAFLINETVVPRASVTSTAILEGLIERGKKDLSDKAITNVTLNSADNRMIFAREYLIAGQTLYDVVILEANANQTLKSKLVAKKARYEDGRWLLYDVVRTRMDRRGNMTGDPVFSATTELEIPEKPEDLIRKTSQVEFMNVKQLGNYISHLSGAKIVQRLSVDLETKIAFPFVSFIVMLIGAALAMRTQRGSAMVGIGTSLVVVILYYGLHSICLALGKGGFLTPMVAAWLTNFVFAGVGIYLIRRAS
ncbi:MAG: LptF/LptG family permease [Candidatus Omnitrophica bacterium]|nr:LptF/LptG family permease [Candidatus Omnitrophota bacterium]